jgi:hypothetical protein
MSVGSRSARCGAGSTRRATGSGGQERFRIHPGPHRRSSPGWTPEYRPQDPQRVEPADLGQTAGHITKGGSSTTEDRYWAAKEAGNEELAAYLAPFVFGEQAAGGDPVALGLWREYETTTRGRTWLRWSNGLRSGLGLGPAGKQPALEGETIYLSGGGAFARREVGA